MATRSLTHRCVGLTSTTPTSVVQGFIRTATTARPFHQNTPRPVFEFLLPRLGTPTQSTYVLKRDGASRNSARCFSSTRARKATITTFNPQKDDDGTEQKIEITQRAADRLQQLRKIENNPNLALRVEVQSGGCHGFQYVMSLCDLPANMPRDLFSKNAALEESSPAINTSSVDPNATHSPTSTSTLTEESTPSLNSSSQDPSAMPTSSPPPKANTSATMDLREDDTVFSYISDQSHARVVMDVFSLDAVKGSKLDYEVKLIGAEFKIIDNPAATSSCGCGTSFDIKFRS
ncbi:hypothetical protein DSL72_006908 [Monilinia vaccinii-corymbosi]|uniref:FeS cluster biogenesis domain-containing protein n=1 Tax=Monilinia vaccinii-corymbosi TaxID=61207 RepID=A0A8A3PLN5_9HELO|nr:hypothetical protein DSL72_006908 [Monilinia vaccinii-corymbosi]